MEQFEKWWREKNKGNYECYSGVASEAWKAALKWMKERCSGAFDFTSTDIDYIVDNEIGEGENATSEKRC